MDTKKQAPNLTTLPPAQLWVGSDQELAEKIHEYMVARWCPAGGCKACITCTQIIEHQYHKSLWICPDGSYTREDLEPIFDALRFSQDLSNETIIVIQKADSLSPACYNSLLKSIEEPPQGYHFLLTARRLKEVAATIRSRCIIANFSSQQEILANPLAAAFTHDNYSSPLDFMNVLETENPDDRHSKELIDTLLMFWIKKYKDALKDHDTRVQDCIKLHIELFELALEEPPMPGSSKLFWKNLFVQFKK